MTEQQGPRPEGTRAVEPLWSDEQMQRMLEDLTPGGSEFHNSPRNCVSYLKDRMSTVVKVARENRDLREQVAGLQAQLVGVLDVAIARGDVLGYENEYYHEMYSELTGKEWSDDCVSSTN